MLEQLAKKDSVWRKTAFVICKDKFLADDIVQEMYLKLMDVNKEIKDFYVVTTMRNIFLDKCKKKKYEHYTDNLELLKIQSEDSKELDDEQQNIINIINKKSEWWQRELLELSNDHSLRELGEMFNIDYGFIFRSNKKVKTEVWEEIRKTNHKELAIQ